MSNLSDYISPDELKYMAIGAILGVLAWVVGISVTVFVIYKIL